MISGNIEEVYISNPSEVVPDDALFYLGLSPYGTADDSAIKKQDLFAQIASSITNLWPPGFIQGFEFALNLVGPPDTLTISPGQCVDSTNLANLVSVSPITITTSNLDTGSWTNGEIYAVWFFKDSTGIEPDIARFSLSFTSPTVPAGYDYMRRVGRVKAQTVSGPNIILFVQTGSSNERTYTYNDADSSRTLATNLDNIQVSPAIVSCAAIAGPFDVKGVANSVFTPASGGNKFYISPGDQAAFPYFQMSGDNTSQASSDLVPFNLTSDLEFGAFVDNAGDSLNLTLVSLTEYL